jgi:phosphohistidine swiveling domain-containing protein
MKDTLWIKFPDESVAGLVFDDAARARFDAVFDVADPSSPWSRAIRAAGFIRLSWPLIKWHEGTPYFNWSAMTTVISGGAIRVLETKDGGYAFHVLYDLRALWNLFSCQWKTVKLMQKNFGGDALVESIALGFVLQSLMLRLGGGAPQDLAKWLAGMGKPPPRHAKTVAQLQAVQVRRTALSPIWKNILPAAHGEEKKLPEFFWNDPPQHETISPAHNGPWKGLPVCPGVMAGPAIAVRKVSEAQLTGKNILVFRRAKPDSVELYPQASALLFCEGGVLSHACVVAREMNIPCITGLGGDFFDGVERDDAILRIDAGAGTVEFLRD